MGVTHDQHIGVHGVEGQRRVDQAFALVYGTGRHRHVDGIRAEALARQFERGAGTGRILEEQVDDGAPAQQVGLAARPRQGDETVGAVQQVGDLVRRQSFDAEDMAMGKARCIRRGGGGGRGGAVEEVVGGQGDAFGAGGLDQLAVMAGGDAPVGAALVLGIGPAMHVRRVNADHRGHRFGAAALGDDMGCGVEHRRRLPKPRPARK